MAAPAISAASPLVLPSVQAKEVPAASVLAPVAPVVAAPLAPATPSTSDKKFDIHALIQNAV